jgi:hypothetical protein
VKGGISGEILFVDPSVPDIESILLSLRTGVEAILLDSECSPAQQIAAALAGPRGLAIVHVMAHGAPGRMRFTASGWSVETLAQEAEIFAVIGRALGSDGDLRLYSCLVGAGKAGFIASLARATGACVSAATGLIGAAALGGRWELAVRLSQYRDAAPPGCRIAAAKHRCRRCDIGSRDHRARQRQHWRSVPAPT